MSEPILLDIGGKNLGVPVYELLGGPLRDKIRVYANGFRRWANTPEPTVWPEPVKE